MRKVRRLAVRCRPTSFASTPVSSMPTTPPRPWQGNTSSVSSMPVRLLRCTATLLTRLATRPTTMLCPTVMKPAAGVTATRPTTAPMQAPMRAGLAAAHPVEGHPPQHRRRGGRVGGGEGQRRRATLAASAEPALKPNQPNQSMPVPSITKGRLAGVRGVVRCTRGACPAPARRPAPRSPRDMCTTVPPAKSSTPHLRRKPSGCHVRARAARR